MSREDDDTRETGERRPRIPTTQRGIDLLEVAVTAMREAAKLLRALGQEERAAMLEREADAALEDAKR